MRAETVHCDVWWATPALAAPHLLALLDPAERERHARFRLAADRDRYAVGHALLRLAVGAASGTAPAGVTFALDCPHCAGTEGRPHGKPRPTGAAAGIEVSLSHSGDRVAVALARGARVGVDVEHIAPGRDLDGLSAAVLTPQEQADLAAVGPDLRPAAFFDYWSRKEALLKATGEGVYAGLTGVSLAPPHLPPAVRSWTTPSAPPAGTVRLHPLDAGPRHRAALAVLTPADVTVAAHDAAELLAGPAPGTAAGPAPPEPLQSGRPSPARDSRGPRRNGDGPSPPERGTRRG